MYWLTMRLYALSTVQMLIVMVLFITTNTYGQVLNLQGDLHQIDSSTQSKKIDITSHFSYF